MFEVTMPVDVSPPFKLNLTVWVLRRRAKNEIDNWDGRNYTRILLSHGSPVLLSCDQSGNQISVKLKSKARLSSARRDQLLSTLRRMLGLDVDLKNFYRLTAKNPLLENLAQPFVGMRPPTFPSLFETLTNAIACQQVSLDVGILLLSRLAKRYGKTLSSDMALRAFPEPADLVDVPEAELKELGFSYQKARSIHDLAYAIENEEIKLDRFEPKSNAEIISQLQSIRGIGRWSAEYALLRGLGRVDVFPGDDIGGQNNLRELLLLENRPGYEELNQLSTQWYPFGGLVYFHLLLTRLRDKGLL